MLAAALAAGSAGTAAAQQLTAVADADPQFNALFHQSMQRPADVDLAFRLAQRAVAVGDYEAAIGVYERILFYNPQLVRVKLELGRLYYRLGAYESARAYFTPISQSPALSEAERQNIAAYLVEIDRRLSTNQWSVYAQAGLRYQSNANYGPSSRIIIGDDVAALLPPSYASQGDGNAFALATIRHVYDFGNQRGDVWESNLSLYYSQQFQLSQLDLGFAEFNTGPRFALFPDAMPGSSVRPYIIAGGIALGGVGYLGTWGAGVSVYTPFSPFFAAEPFVEVRQRDYQNTADYPTAGFQSGAMWTVGANLFGRVSDDIRWRARLAYNDASGELPWYGYDNFAIDLALPIEFQGLWGIRRWVAIPSIGYSRYSYDAPNPFITNLITQTDNQYRVGFALDVPVYEQWGLLTQVQYSWSDSTLPNYAFDNFSVSVGPNVRF
ncbi:tetratricopeptide repeat protein [Xanthobacter sp. AM11]|uniref:tetratricopeptide repeat protein n=1 Tax=Xanthobacter sp. AM11 TaxID=3380643 RepID=UPI0039BF1972